MVSATMATTYSFKPAETAWIWRLPAGEQPPGERHHERRDEQPRARSERPHHQEQRGDIALRPRAESDAEIVVDRVDLVLVIGLEKEVADHEPPEISPSVSWT